MQPQPSLKTAAGRAMAIKKATSTIIDGLKMLSEVNHSNQ